MKGYGIALTMVFADRLYLSPEIKEEYKIHIKSLKKNKSSFFLYLAVFLEGETELCLIHNSIFLANYRKSDAFIVGLALGKTEGMRLIRDIIEDTYKKRKDFNYYGFLRKTGGK